MAGRLRLRPARSRPSPAPLPALSRALSRPSASPSPAPLQPRSRPARARCTRSYVVSNWLWGALAGCVWLAGWVGGCGVWAVGGRGRWTAGWVAGWLAPAARFGERSFWTKRREVRKTRKIKKLLGRSCIVKLGHHRNGDNDCRRPLVELENKSRSRKTSKPFRKIAN